MKWLFISETQDVHTSAEARKSEILTVLFMNKNSLVEPKKGEEEKNGKKGIFFDVVFIDEKVKRYHYESALGM